MPIVTIKGLTADVPKGPLRTLKTQLALAVASVDELDLTMDQVSVFMPADLLEETRGDELIVFVDGLFMKPERTKAVRQQMADAVCDALKVFVWRYMPDCELIEVIPRSQYPDDGFSSWRKGE